MYNYKIYLIIVILTLVLCPSFDVQSETMMGSHTYSIVDNYSREILGTGGTEQYDFITFLKDYHAEEYWNYIDKNIPIPKDRLRELFEFWRENVSGHFIRESGLNQSEKNIIIIEAFEHGIANLILPDSFDDPHSEEYQRYLIRVKGYSYDDIQTTMFAYEISWSIAYLAVVPATGVKLFQAVKTVIFPRVLAAIYKMKSLGIKGTFSVKTLTSIINKTREMLKVKSLINSDNPIVWLLVNQINVSVSQWMTRDPNDPDNKFWVGFDDKKRGFWGVNKHVVKTQLIDLIGCFSYASLTGIAGKDLSIFKKMVLVGAVSYASSRIGSEIIDDGNKEKNRRAIFEGYYIGIYSTSKAHVAAWLIRVLGLDMPAKNPKINILKLLAKGALIQLFEVGGNGPFSVISQKLFPPDYDDSTYSDENENLIIDDLSR